MNSRCDRCGHLLATHMWVAIGLGRCGNCEVCTGSAARSDVQEGK